MSREYPQKKENYKMLMPEDYAEPMCLLSGEPYGTEPEIKAVLSFSYYGYFMTAGQLERKARKIYERT